MSAGRGRVERRCGPTTKPQDCRHPRCTPAWDEEWAKGKTEAEIRARFPRFHGRCPDCGQSVIVYASAAQYIGGDY